MRAKDFPPFFFEKLRQQLGEPPVETFYWCGTTLGFRWKTRSEHDLFFTVHGGWYPLTGHFSRFEIWGDTAREEKSYFERTIGARARKMVAGLTGGENAVDDTTDMLILDHTCLLCIHGGATYQPLWKKGLGQELVEDVIVKFTDAYACCPGYTDPNVMPWFSLDDPLAATLGIILGQGFTLMREARIEKLRYWEAFLNPNANYDQPPCSKTVRKA